MLCRLPNPLYVPLPLGTRYASMTYWFRMSVIALKYVFTKYDVLPLKELTGDLSVSFVVDIPGAVGDSAVVYAVVLYEARSVPFDQ